MSMHTPRDPATWKRYWKTIVAALGAIVVIGNEIAEAVTTAYGDGKFETNDAVTVAIAVITAIGVYAKANTPTTTRLQVTSVPPDNNIG